MGLHSIDFEVEEKLIEYMKLSFSDQEIFSIGRRLNLDKRDYYSRSMTPSELRERFIETVIQKDILIKLFTFLQSPEYFRERLEQYYEIFGIKPPVEIHELERVRERLIETTYKGSELLTQSNEEWINHCLQNKVLILGKDNTDESFNRLLRIKDIVSQNGYTPVIIKEQPEIEILTNEEKMLAYATLSRFIIIEKSEPSGHIDEAHICAINKFPSIWIQRENTGDTWMQGEDYELTYKSIKFLKYNDDKIEKVIKEAIKWVESYLKEKTETLNKIYPWR